MDKAGPADRTPSAHGFASADGLRPTAVGEPPERCLQRIGLAVRARRAAVGGDAALAAIRRGEAKLVILAADAGGNARKKYRDKCAFYHIPLLEAFDRNRLGRACGRAEAAVVAVTDPGFAASVMACVGEYRGGEAFDKTSGV